MAASRIKQAPGLRPLNFQETSVQTEIPNCGKPTTSSLDVAAYSGKRHADILRAIDGLECTADFTQRNFALSEYQDGTGRMLRAFNMTKDGFTFLVMRFTGKMAVQG